MPVCVSDAPAPSARAMPKSATSAWPSEQQDVLRLDVAVDDAVVVRVVERAGDLARDAQRVGHRQLPLAVEPVAQGLALDERHREPELAVGLARVEHGEDVRMLQPRGEPDLALEALGAQRWRRARGAAP